MKKSLMILASVALGASMAVGSTNVESRNIVGYNHVGLPTPGYTLIGVNWQKPDGSSLSIQDVFNTNDLYAGGDVYASDGDQIIIWDPTLNGGLGSYVTYYYYFQDAPENAAWFDVADMLATNKLAPGMAFWFGRFASSGSTNVIVNGQVASNATVQLTMPVGYSMIASGYPIEPVIGNGITGYPGTDVYSSDGDQIIVWDSTLNGGNGSYVTYYYYYQDVPGNAQWYDVADMPVIDVLKLGQAAWYFRQGATSTSWTQNKPL